MCKIYKLDDYRQPKYDPRFEAAYNEVYPAFMLDPAYMAAELEKLTQLVIELQDRSEQLIEEFE